MNNSYFESLEEIQQFTMDLDLHSDSLECKKCLKKGCFVSHGFIYKNGHQGEKKIVGKRIFCSNRNGRSGCGCTSIIYLKEAIPALTYDTSNVSTFLSKLISGSSIGKAYKATTNTNDPRNASMAL